MPDPITIKGIREGLLVTVGDAETWPITAQGLLTRIDETADFFKGAKLALAIGARAISAAVNGLPFHLLFRPDLRARDRARSPCWTSSSARRPRRCTGVTASRQRHVESHLPDGGPA